MAVKKCVFNSTSNIQTLADYISAGNATALNKWCNVTVDTTKMWSTTDLWLSCVHKNIPSRVFGMTSGNSAYAQQFIEKTLSESWLDGLRSEISRSSGEDTFIDIDSDDCGAFGVFKISSGTVSDFLLEVVADNFVIAFYNGYKSSNNNTCYCIYNDGSTVRFVNMLSTIQSYITQRKALGNEYATDYSAQPIIVYGRKTPIYSITSNSNSPSPALYQEVVIDGQRFFIVGTDMGIKC